MTGAVSLVKGDSWMSCEAATVVHLVLFDYTLFETQNLGPSLHRTWLCWLGLYLSSRCGQVVVGTKLLGIR